MSETRRRRRGANDPARRERILEATLRVIEAHGVQGASHRIIAAEAGVPLGSLTYYFAGLEDILEQSFTLLAERSARSYGEDLATAATTTAAAEVVADFAHSAAVSSSVSSVLLTEMYAYANHNLVVQQVLDRWLLNIRTSLESQFSSDASKAIDAFVEGLLLHRQWSQPHVVLDRQRVVQAIQALARCFPK